ncbi:MULTISPECIES: ABC transporter substrate-binding protein [unclassified Arthrobacter]|uniref:ABC transporter substrate-binding protein n=1 Tax=unclassified Arthrobacter TaxID=235627 RepID=UPI001492F4AD|nr:MULTISPECIES: ABC transporter substrate-binding protein [unclassified Arthrobacter]MBE0008278.1 aliphatic sulfonate ABC transporter substrate-binding protein [Arthrobacter sp. AET 35A]NOJ62017.1 ABC transporter substrate-binding protein [Arthrobacter sp. 147(2020)]
MARKVAWARTAVAIPLVVMLSGCGGLSSVSNVAGTAPDSVRLGYFPNLTHAPALIADAEGLYAEHLAATNLEVSTFNAGPSAIEALFSGAIDMAVIGPNPTINGFAQSGGEALRVVAGVASGGAALVVRPGIKSAADLSGATLATPQLGNTQDVALRTWLAAQGFRADTEGGGDVSIMPQDNASALQAFNSGQIDGAWVPEPWLTRLVEEGGGQVLVDEQALWPEGAFIVANVVVRAEFLRQHPDTVEAMIEGQLDALAFMEESPEEAMDAFNSKMDSITGQSINEAYLEEAWRNVDFLYDPLPSTLITGAEHAVSVGLLNEVDLDGLYDLGPLNRVLERRELEPVAAP